MRAVLLRHEWRQVRRVALIGWCAWAACVVAALVVGERRVRLQREAARQFVETDERQIAHYRERAEAIERVRAGGTAGAVKLHPDELDWGPTQPLYVAAWVPMKAVATPSRLGALAVGDTDIVSPAYQVQLWDRELLPIVEPSDNPLLASVGRFDLALVIVLLLPLLAIALTFDMTAAERDAGILPLLLAQPVPPRRLWSAKVLVRASVVAIAVALGGLVIAAVVGVRADALRPLACWLAAALAYGVLWVLAGAAVDGLGRPASWNALALAAAWLAATCIVPGLAQAMASWRHPVPPRVEGADQRRQFEDALEKEFDTLDPAARDALIDRFFAAHPEYRAPMPAHGKIGFFYAARIAHHDARGGERRRLAAPADEARQAQEEWAAWMRYLSPAALAREVLVEVAGSGRGRQRHFLSEAARYDVEYTRFLWPRLFTDARFSSREFDRIPRFQLQDEAWSAVWDRVKHPLAALYALDAVLAMLGIVAARRLASP